MTPTRNQSRDENMIQILLSLSKSSDEGYQERFNCKFKEENYEKLDKLLSFFAAYREKTEQIEYGKFVFNFIAIILAKLINGDEEIVNIKLINFLFTWSEK